MKTCIVEDSGFGEILSQEIVAAEFIVITFFEEIFEEGKFFFSNPSSLNNYIERVLSSSNGRMMLKNHRNWFIQKNSPSHMVK